MTEPAGRLLDRTPKHTLRDRAWQRAYRAGFPLVRLACGLIQPRHTGALVAIWLDGALLLVRASYRRPWTLPGGGVHPRETPAQAATRELREELGIEAHLTTQPYIVRGTWDGLRDEVHVFELPMSGTLTLRRDNREIVAARLFKPTALAGTPVTGPVAAYLLARSERTPHRA